ncbi:hypothetical protein EJ110_NYTH31874 [Nymphaea thermarum]|nr:hypothetical protein EJ110_NYTH31874 [Nymphaea thermarum]
MEAIRQLLLHSMPKGGHRRRQRNPKTQVVHGHVNSLPPKTSFRKKHCDRIEREREIVAFKFYTKMVANCGKRTANDVKNYWNSYFVQKVFSQTSCTGAPSSPSTSHGRLQAATSQSLHENTGSCSGSLQLPVARSPASVPYEEQQNKSKRRKKSVLGVYFQGTSHGWDYCDCAYARIIKFSPLGFPPP